MRGSLFNLIIVGVAIFSATPVWAQGSSPDHSMEVGRTSSLIPSHNDSSTPPADVEHALADDEDLLRTAETPAGFHLAHPEKVFQQPFTPTVRMTGFFQADAAFFAQSPENIIAVGDIQDGADFRRARLQAVGQVFENVGYSIEFDFAFPGRPSFMDVWLELQETFGPGNVRIGQYRQPASMDAMTSVKDLTFLERALPFALVPFRQIGAMYWGTAAGEEMTYAVSLYRFPTDVYGGNIGDDGGYSFITRETAVLLESENDGLIHLGGSYGFSDPANDAVQYRNQPEVFISETGGGVPVGVPTNVPPFVDTGVIPTRNINLFGAELGARYGSLHMQSEFLVSVVSRPGAETVVFPGAYVQAGYLLTGEVRPYSKTNGVFGRIEPLCPVTRQGGMGAWEIAARWSYLDLDDDDVQGGTLNDLTFGTNWYLNKNTKFQLNYIHAFLNDSIVGRSDADIVAMRAQVDF